MEPHRPGYRPHADQAHSDPHPSPTMRRPRHSPMQPSGLPQGPMEMPHDYGSGHAYHSKPPPLDHRAAQVDRYAPQRSHHLPPRSHHERPHDGLELASIDSRNRSHYYQEREAHRPSEPPYSPRYSAASTDPRAHTQYFSDQPRSRQPHSHESPHMAHHQHPDQYTHRHAHPDDRYMAPSRPPMVSPTEERERLAYVHHREGYAPAGMSEHARYPPTHSASDSRDAPYHASRSSGPFGSFPPRPAPATTRKRKKQFKYMFEQGEADSSKAMGVEGAEDELEGERTDQHDELQGSESAVPRKESRKKVKKACVFCKRSHMPCEEARPCKRCVKRGISHLCRDAEPANSTGASSNHAAASSSSTGASANKGKFEEARQAAHARRRRDDGSQAHTAETDTTSDAESMSSSAASSMVRRRIGSDAEFNAQLAGREKAFGVQIPGATSRDPDFRPSMPIADLLSPHKLEMRQRPVKRADSPGISQQEQKDAWNRSLDLSTQNRIQELIEAGPSGGDLSDITAEVPISLLMTPAMANLPKGQAILRPGSAGPPSSSPHQHDEKRLKRSHSMSLSPNQPQVDASGFKLPARPKHLLQEEAATASELRGGGAGYSYTYGYAKLARWMHSRFTRAHCEQVDRSLAAIRPGLMALSRSLPEKELTAVEDRFYQLLNFYQANVLEMIPIPMIVTRRTGEIYAANEPACKLFQLPKSLFEGGQICHYQLVTEQDCVDMWAKYAKEASGKLDTAPSQYATLEVDRSLLLFNKPGVDPRSGELLEGNVCADGGPVVIRRRVIVTFEAKLSKHGLPFFLSGYITPLPDA